MTLRSKLVAAQLPLLVALIAVALGARLVAESVGASAKRILRDNYRSVLAAERMKEAIERMDSAATFAIAGRADLAATQAAANRKLFDDELKVQEGNITEPGEADATADLRARWTEYQRLFDGFVAKPEAKRYFDEMLPAFTRVKDAAETILLMNQDAMVHKAELSESDSARAGQLLLLGSIVGMALGLFASASITTRIVRPVAVLGATARRLGGGDLAARAVVTGKDEIARLATEFNAMAEKLQRYRESSLGELLEAQAAAQSAIDSLSDPVIVLGLAGDLLHANRAAEGLLGVSVEKGLTIGDPALRAAVEKVHRHVIAGRGAWSPRGLAESVRTASGEGERFFLPRATPVHAQAGALAGATIVLENVTRQIRFEQLRSDLVATVAHELRTPLTSLRMAIHLLIEQHVGALTEKQADLVYAAREDCDRLQSTVDELLDLSRIQAGRLEIRVAPADVEALAKEAVETHRAAAAKADVTLRSEVLPGIPPVSADAERIQLVFDNLLSNAIRHSPKGGAVAVRAREVDGGAVRFEVADQGPGIAREYHQAIFEKYFQMPGTAGGGAGLGLFIAREIVQAHGGAIGVDSEPGAGATFWFTLKRAG